MSVAVITLSPDGGRVARRIHAELDSDLFVPSTLDVPEAEKFSDGIGALTSRTFLKYRNLIYIMPLGVAVRSIAPHIKDKHTDPAVVVVDVSGRYVISLLSAHEGGANALAQKISNILKTDAVITTSTEAVKDLIVGVGCRKGADAETIAGAVRKTLEVNNLSLDRVRFLATADIKAKEEGLLKSLEFLGIPLKVVSSGEIKTCAKEYNKSDFVAEKVGLGGVAAPAALLAGRKTKLLIEKTKYPGVTVAVAQENFTW
jgi:cobalt-precorrin 5A hydrolase